MNAFRRHLRACTWLALVAMAAIAFGPTVSRLRLPAVAPLLALAAPAQEKDHDGAMGSSPMGSMVHAVHDHHASPGVPRQQPSAPPPHGHGLDHCGLCVVAAWAFAVAPPLPHVLPAVDVGRRAAASGEPGVAPARAPWSPSQPRGPPWTQ